jgi:hypothetical protein
MNQSRRPSGQPTGGQFAAKSNPESDAELPAEPVHDPPVHDPPVHDPPVHRTIEELDTEARSRAPGDHIDWQVARALPTYTKVAAEFTVMPGRTFRLMARDLPRGYEPVERRFTNLDTGTEVFLPPDGLIPPDRTPAGEPMFRSIVVTKNP